MNKKVRVGSLYRFEPASYDILWQEHYLATPGDIVRVINLPSAPRANTMGHCHIDSVDGRFLGLVCTASLTKVKA